MFTLKLYLTRMVKRNYEVVLDSRRPLEGSSAPKKSPEQEVVEKTIKDFDEYRKNGGKDHLVLMRLLRSIHDANEKFAKKNYEASEKIDADITNAIKNSTDMNQADMVQLHNYHIGLRRERLEAAKTLDAKTLAQASKTKNDVVVAKTDVSKTQLEAMNKRAGLTEAVDAKDNNPRQAEALLKGLAMMKDNKGAQALLKRLTTDNNGDNYISLSSLNIGAFIDWMAHGMKIASKGWRGASVEGYRTNGADNGETLALQKIADAMKGNPDVIALAKTIRAFYDANQTSEDWLIAQGKVRVDATREAYTQDDIKRYFTTYREGTFFDFRKTGGKDGKTELYRFESADRSFFTPYPKGELESYFGKLSESELTEKIKDIVKIGGGTITGDTLKNLFDVMQQNPVLRANYIQGLNLIAMSPSRGEYFRGGKFVLGFIADSAVKFVDELKKKDTLELMRRSLDNGAQANREAVVKNLALTPVQRKNILDGIDTFVNRMKSNEELNSIMLDGMLAITNKGATAGGGATMSLNSMLADSVSGGGSVATDYKGGFGAALSLAFTKELYHSNKADFNVHYGVMAESGGLSPFAGAHGTYDKFIAAVTKGPGFVNLFLGMKVGQNTEMIRNLESLSSAQKEIHELAVKNNLETISLKNLVSDPAIAARMDRTVQSILRMNGFKPELSIEIRYAMLYGAVVEAMKQEVLILRRESNDNGWVMKQIGINFGKIAGLTYILPGFQIGRDDIVTQVSVGTERVKISSERSIIDPTTLFDSVKFKEGTKEYYLPLKEKSKIKTSPTTLPEFAIWDMDSSGNVIGISSLKDFGIKVTVLDGKYAIEYDKTKPVQNDKKIDGIKDKAPEVVDLARIDIVKTALSNKNFRVNLSSLLSGWESAGGIEMKKKASRFAELLQVQKIAEARDLFVDMTKGNKTFKAVSDYLAKESDVIKLQAALFDLRGGMMMDVTQANKVQANGTEVVIAESITDTEKRFEGMMKNPNMKELLVSMGLDISDYATLIRAGGGTEKRLTLSGIKPGVLGAVASLKTVKADGKGADAYMARMPAGTMRFAENAGQEFTRPITDGVKQRKVMDVILPANSDTDKAYRTALAKVLGITEKDALTKVSREVFTSLVVSGKATIDGKNVTMSGQTFMLCAYGDCTNPGVAMSIGKISTPDIPGKKHVDISGIAETSLMSEVASYSTQVGTESVRLGVFAGRVSPPRNTPPDVTTTPGVDPNRPGTVTQPGADRGPAVTPGAGAAPGTPNGGPAGTTGTAAPRPGSVAPAPLPGAVTQPAPLPGPVANGPVAPPPSSVVPAVTPNVSAGDIAKVGTILRGNGE